LQQQAYSAASSVRQNDRSNRGCCFSSHASAAAGYQLPCCCSCSWCGLIKRCCCSGCSCRRLCASHRNRHSTCAAACLLWLAHSAHTSSSSSSSSFLHLPTAS
jgi:hypothetical protein